jgi:hypothetical protein
MMVKLSHDQRRALVVLASVGEMGATEALMLAHGFEMAMLVDLVRDGLANTAPESVWAGGRKMEVTRLRITESGRQALVE